MEFSFIQPCVQELYLRKNDVFSIKKDSSFYKKYTGAVRMLPCSFLYTLTTHGQEAASSLPFTKLSQHAVVRNNNVAFSNDCVIILDIFSIFSLFALFAKRKVQKVRLLHS